MFVQLLSVLRHLDVLLGECWVCQSWSLGVFGPLWGITPGSASKGECGDASAAGFGELGQGREGWGLCPLYRVTHTPESWSLEISKYKCTISWLTCPVSPLRATACIAHRITRPKCYFGLSSKTCFKKRSQSLHQFYPYLLQILCVIRSLLEV